MHGVAKVISERKIRDREKFSPKFLVHNQRRTFPAAVDSVYCGWRKSGLTFSKKDYAENKDKVIQVLCFGKVLRCMDRGSCWLV